jgi:hypothetical protein
MMTDRRMRLRAVAATILLFAAALVLAWAAAVLLSGGLALGAIVSRDPVRPLMIAVFLAAIARVLSPADFDATFVRLVGPRGQWAARAAAAMALAVLVVSIAWNTRAAGGSDSSCYVLQADAFAHGEALLRHPLAGTIPNAAPAIFAPAGFLPARAVAGAAVPICAPGLALAMAGASLVAGRAAIFLVVPASAALLVWLTFVLGRRVDDPLTGVASAVLVACSPIVLYQSVQPMSDVPATALWLGAVTASARGDARGDLLAGLCASLAVITRPNLAVAVLPLLWLLRGWRAWVRFGVAAAPGLGALAWLNAIRYGSVLVSGYGDTGHLFSIQHVLANLARYPRWTIATESPLVVVALAAPWIVRRDPARLRLTLAALASSALIVATYLAYVVFDDWWYVRFLLPALPLVLVLSVAVVLRVASHVGTAGARRVVAAAMCAILAAWYLHVARARHVFELQALESRFVLAGRYAARELPANAVVIAGQHTGSIRYHGGRTTLAWDGVPPDGLDRVAASLEASGHPVVIALESGEIAGFVARFPTERLGRLDWAPAAVLSGAGRVRFFLVPPGLRRLTSTGGDRILFRFGAVRRTSSKSKPFPGSTAWEENVTRKPWRSNVEKVRAAGSKGLTTPHPLSKIGRFPQTRSAWHGEQA